MYSIARMDPKPPSNPETCPGLPLQLPARNLFLARWEVNHISASEGHRKLKHSLK